MPKTNHPRRGSMQFWPRKRAVREFGRVRHWPVKLSESKLLGFAGYKAGMTHAVIVDNKSTSQTHKQQISIPVTIIECPPLKVASIRFYKKDAYGLKVASEIMIPNLDKELAKRIAIPKTIKKTLDSIKPEEYAEIRVNVYTQPKLTGIGKKKPEYFEMGLGGNNVTSKFEFAKQILGKEIKVSDVFKEGMQIDIKGVTKGKGFQGPVKRFGVDIRSHKAEKTKRGPANISPWHPHHGNYRVSHAGQMGYHLRRDLNKWVIKISEDSKLVQMKGGIKHYGVVKNSFIIVKGSVPGPRKRMVRLNLSERPDKLIPNSAPEIKHLSLESKQ